MSRRRTLTMAAAVIGALLATWPYKPRAQQPAAPGAPAQAAHLTGIAADPSGARVILMPTVGPCTGHARQALHITPAGQRTAGCWIRTINTIHIAYLDGETGTIPAADITWTTGI